ncbi:hypothetical protein Tco_0427333 [Tanacetum coccineum]
MTFSRLAKEVLVEVLAEKSIVQREVTDIIKEEGENWMLPIWEYLLFGLLPKDPQKPRKLRVKAPPYRVIDGNLYRPLPMATGGARSISYADSELLIIGNSLPKVPFRSFAKGLAYTSTSLRSIILKQMEKWRSQIETSSRAWSKERIKEFKVRTNDKRRRENLDLLEERREIASIREAYYKQKLERYYNKRVQPSTFKLGIYVLRLNSASKDEFQAKTGPTWEGSYIVRKASGDGAYKLERLSGSSVDRT